MKRAEEFGMVLTATDDAVPSTCVVSFDNLHTLPRSAFRRRLIDLSPPRMAGACRALRAGTGC